MTDIVDKTLWLKRCAAVVKSVGRRCKNEAPPGSEFCRTHDKAEMRKKYRPAVDA